MKGHAQPPPWPLALTFQPPPNASPSITCASLLFNLINIILIN
ncbi:hypothetical protein OIU79_030048 [Salix purpurea]|uniref:Uncharacterized protein n=1 Tax=Salix purpurea TaxID=77065 RepID=A0A9Q0VI65_SALPP|nr:hypothetical protein OIU79_030048 [Salix purpurea]